MTSFAGLARLALICLACLASLALAACGGGDEPSTSPEDATKTFLTALAEQDSAAACAVISSQGLDEFTQEDQNCEDAVGGALNAAGGTDPQQVEDATFTVDDQTEDTATVTATRSDGQEQSFDLVAEDGEWKIAG